MASALKQSSPHDRAHSWTDSAQPITFADEYTEACQLWASRQGTVELVKHRTSSKLQVFKQILFREDKRVDVAYLEEACGLSLLNNAFAHLNIVQMVFAERLPDFRYVMCLERCNGDLHNQMQRFRRRGMVSPALFVLQCLIGVGQALGYIHHGLVRTSMRPLPERMSVLERYHKVAGASPKASAISTLKPEMFS